MKARPAVRIAEDPNTKEVDASRCAFLWCDVYAVEDETGRTFEYPKELTWIRTVHGCYYIEGRFDDVLAEWDAYLEKNDTTLAFTRN
jgi:hypothetical protein